MDPLCHDGDKRQKLEGWRLRREGILRMLETRDRLLTGLICNPGLGALRHVRFRTVYDNDRS